MDKEFGKEVLGRTYKAENGTTFVVMEIDPYPEERISKQYRDQLKGMAENLLVAVPYRTTFIPNITLNGGVVRLIKVAVSGKLLERPIDISKALGLTQPYVSQGMQFIG